MKKIADVLRRVDGKGPPEWLTRCEPEKVRSLFSSHSGPRREDIEREIEEARIAAEMEGLRAAQAKVETIMERYLDGIRRIAEVTRDARRPVASEVVMLAMVVAREILGHELTVDRDRTVELVDQAMKQVEGESEVVVRLGKADLAYLRQRRPDLVEAGVIFVEDDRLGVGGCVVETPDSITDATMEARLQRVARALAEVYAEAPPASPDEPVGDEERIAC